MTTRTGVTIANGKTKLILDNIKCGGCASTITSALEAKGTSHVNVNPEDGSVVFDTPCTDEKLEGILATLKGLGYPLIDTEEGLRAMALKAKSYLSCAIGKMNK